ncbi:hypothetical protein Agub_g6371 [Astrephomene gubernaculifera]|uniref:Ribosomal RNA small subunit methyltransferase G n=1 Tax=Astrephomene gubernaculifera TaxID=47775 RepID=A0AAD3DNT7_9CHLO|nr:hypothetical protein Agub_g6371 [Astrephomene gubernaculifera]
MLLSAGRGCALAAFGRVLLPIAVRPQSQCQVRAGVPRGISSSTSPSVIARDEEPAGSGPSSIASSTSNSSPGPPRSKAATAAPLAPAPATPNGSRETHTALSPRSKQRRSSASLPSTTRPGPPSPPEGPPQPLASTPASAVRQYNTRTSPPSPHRSSSSSPAPSTPTPTSSTPPTTSSSSSPPAAAAHSSASYADQAASSRQQLAQQLSARQQQQLETYLDYMLEVNQSMNLTAVRDKGEAWERHVVDSLALLPLIERHAQLPAALPQQQHSSRSNGHASSSSGGSGSAGSGLDGLRVIDVGTGAGLPGMVLAAVRPQWKVTLLDSLRKRCDFLREAAERAGLSNVEVVWCRAEEGGRRPELREAYDVAVARAVAEARVLAELCLPFVRVGGLWVAAKGPNPEAEAAAAASAVRQLGGSPLKVLPVDSYSGEGQRTALLSTKRGPTPARFPRHPGVPSKKPL